MKMATKLKNLKVKRVALVDDGSNPDAVIRFAKSKGEQSEQPVENEQGIIKRALAVLAKALGIELEKGAHTFAEAETARNYDAVMDKEIYPMHWAMMDSVRSILTDTDIDGVTKEALLKQTLAEYSEAYTRAAPSWAKAELANESVSKSEDEDGVPVLVKVRDHLNELIGQGCCGGSGKKPVKKGDAPDGPDSPDSPDNPDSPDGPGKGDGPEDGGGKEPPVRKGAIHMIFDTQKMNAEELAAYNDLAKRFGKEEHAPAIAPAPDAGAEDVYKGLHPTVQAELESLRKFRAEQEDRQYLEVAKKYALLGKKPEELAPVLKGLKAAGGDAYAGMIALLDSAVQAVEKSGVFGEIGKRGSGGTSGDDAWGKIEVAAQEIAKSRPEMRWAQAVDAACEAHPELVQEYEKSRC